MTPNIIKISCNLSYLLFAIIILLGCASKPAIQVKNSNSLVLLVPDRNDSLVVDPRITAWIDAAQEEGFVFSVMTDFELVKLGNKIQEIPGIIIPDHTHQIIDDSLLSVIEEYVSSGGKLMLTYDAGTFTKNKFYSIPKSRLSHLAGVDYVMYKDLQNKMISTDVVVGSEKVMWQLQIPPGKSMPYLHPSRGQLNRLFSSTNKAKSRTARKSEIQKRADEVVGSSENLFVITGYTYGKIKYPSFVTRGNYSGKVLLASPNNGLIAGVNSFGKGSVLFVNLPLSRLKGDTDGVLMHGFLKYFADDLAQLPRLATHPKATGGIVLNWHVDSSAALESIAKLDNMKVWDSGPYSIHITAGPDTNFFGDKIGLDVLNNKTTQNWIKYFIKKGHEIGSHGGWIHNYFAANAHENNQGEFQKFLEFNKDAIESVTSQSISEYSSPSGNNPQWAVDWLENNGFIAYYFVGHTGLSVTRNYRDGNLQNPKIWAFPVTIYGEYATIEEFSVNNISSAEISQWVSDLLEFNRRNQTSRLIYFHPPGAMLYPSVIKGLIKQTNNYINDGRFEWYTMSELANFQTRRLKVKWKVNNLTNGDLQIDASHPDYMTDITWTLPIATYGKPNIIQGNAKIIADSDRWMVIVSSGKKLSFTARKKEGN